MDTRRILGKLRAERERLDRAIVAIEGLDGTSTRAARTSHATVTSTPRGRRRMSAAARKRLSALMKARWASGKMKRARKA
jgi:hypothetical protein